MFKIALFYIVFLSIVVSNVWVLIKKQVLYLPSDDFIALKSLDKKQIDSITLALEPYRGVMLATNFLGKVNLYSIEDSYFPKIDYMPNQISAKNPLLIAADSCILNSAIDFTKLTSKLILITKVSQLDKNVFIFNQKAYCNGMRLHAVQGFSSIENWGVWSEGEKTIFTIEMDEPYPRGGKLTIDFRPAINPNIANDERIVLVNIDGENNKQFIFSSSDQATMEIDFDKKDAGSKMKVTMNHVNPIRFSDISGNDHRRVSLGFLSAKLIANDDGGQIRIASVAGAYDRETDRKNWWHWVEHKVSFKLEPLFVQNEASQTRLYFEYGTRGAQRLTLRLAKRDGSSKEVLLQSEGDTLTIFEQIFDFAPVELVEVSIETNGGAFPLGNGDPRVASWIVRNVNITPVLP